MGQFFFFVFFISIYLYKGTFGDVYAVHRIREGLSVTTALKVCKLDQDSLEQHQTCIHEAEILTTFSSLSENIVQRTRMHNLLIDSCRKYVGIEMEYFDHVNPQVKSRCKMQLHFYIL